MHSDFRRCLVDLDTVTARKLWAQASPHLHQPANDEEALVMLHYARTEARSVAFRLRAYSHRWLVDQGLPSALPDELKPKAERIYPKVVEAVFVGVISNIVGVKEGLTEAMRSAVEEAYADGKTDPDFLRARIVDAQDRFFSN